MTLLLGRTLDPQKSSTLSRMITDYATPVRRLPAPHSRRKPVPLGLFPPLITSPRSQGMGTPTPDTRTDAGLPSNEASNEPDPGKHQDATAVPGSDADADAAEDVLSLLPTRALDRLLFVDMLQRPFVLLYHVSAAARAAELSEHETAILAGDQAAA